MRFIGNDLLEAQIKTLSYLKSNHEVVESDTWQSQKSPFKFLEVLNVSVIAKMASSDLAASEYTLANQPWAHEHFDERVGGKPLNPPPSHVRWASGTEDHLSIVDETKFSHSYPERMWPKTLMPNGIRYKTGDLDDAVALLMKDPLTRQCYIPMVFPEDLTAARFKERVPCSLGWHFIVRRNELHCFYPMRSCDAIRHMHNDWYFANMLTLWMHEHAGLGEHGIKIGNLHFVATSLHCFDNDLFALEQRIKQLKETFDVYRSY